MSGQTTSVAQKRTATQIDGGIAGSSNLGKTREGRNVHFLDDGASSSSARDTIRNVATLTTDAGSDVRRSTRLKQRADQIEKKSAEDIKAADVFEFVVLDEQDDQPKVKRQRIHQPARTLKQEPKEPILAIAEEPAAPPVSRYQGQKLNGLKHGNGTYDFGDGRKYEGSWVNDKIHGHGEYTSDLGVYVGNWENGMRCGHGVFTGNDGWKYDGNWMNNVKTGRGIESFEGNVRYDGEYVNSKYHGKGILTFQNGDIYEGYFVNGRFDGVGKLTTMSGVYEGHFHQGKRWGDGTMKYSSGSQYTGEWENGHRSGKGKLIVKDGNVIEGSWKNDSVNGYATCVIKEEKGTYEGYWAEGKPDGYGKRTYGNGDVYEGLFKNGKYEGQGKLTRQDGNIYQGTWKENQRSGFGIQTYSDHGVYEGNWENDNRSGQGTKKYPNGNEYSGQWLNDKKHGNGTQFFTADGSKYEGNWVEGFARGQGKLILKNGQEFEGVWTDGYRCGEGVIRYQDNVYKGKWENLKRCGFGNDVYKDNSQYTGMRVNDKRHGKGTYFFSPTGSTYEGFWFEGVKSGDGTLTENACTYTGVWDNNRLYFGTMFDPMRGTYKGELDEKRRPHGQGKFIMIDKTVYEGNWKDGDIHGTATCVYSNGDKYVGGWINTHRCGGGKLTCFDGRIYEGEWTFLGLTSGSLTYPNQDQYEGEFDDQRLPHGMGKLIRSDGTIQQGRFEHGQFDS